MRLILRVQEDIARFEIPMDDTRLVGRVQGVSPASRTIVPPRRAFSRRTASHEVRVSR